MGDDRRVYGAYFTRSHLEELIAEAGFRLCLRQADPSLNTTTYLVRKTPETPRDPRVVNVDDITEFTWIEELQKVVEERLNQPEQQTIWLQSTEVRNNGTLGLALCFVEENLKYNRFRTLADISVKKKYREGPSRVRIDDEHIQKMMQLDLHANNYRDGVWGSVRHIVVKDDEAHTFKDVEHAFINTTIRGDVSSLTWVESPNQFFEATPDRPTELELCHVYYSAVNFRDVMLAYGRLPPDAIPGQFADRECLLGMEFAGRLKNGQRVMGILPGKLSEMSA